MAKLNKDDLDQLAIIEEDIYNRTAYILSYYYGKMYGININFHLKPLKFIKQHIYVDLAYLLGNTENPDKFYCHHYDFYDYITRNKKGEVLERIRNMGHILNLAFPKNWLYEDFEIEVDEVVEKLISATNKKLLKQNKDRKKFKELTVKINKAIKLTEAEKKMLGL